MARNAIVQHDQQWCGSEGQDIESSNEINVPTKNGHSKSRKIVPTAHCICNTQKVSMVLYSKCPELFAGDRYRKREFLNERSDMITSKMMTMSLKVN